MEYLTGYGHMSNLILRMRCSVLLILEPWRRAFGCADAIAHFGKDPPQLTLPEGRDAAGIIPAPNVYVPGKHPNRGDSRRNLILRAMPHTDAMRTENYENAKQAELEIIPLKADATDAPYLVDFIREELMKDYSEEKLMTNGLGGYTATLPPLLMTSWSTTPENTLPSLLLALISSLVRTVIVVPASIVRRDWALTPVGKESVQSIAPANKPWSAP
jgi:hypothetical protein